MVYLKLLFLILSTLPLLVHSVFRSFPVSSIQGEGDTIPCPHEELLAAVRENITASLTTLSLLEKPECGDGYWQRVAYLNMSNPSHQCPPGWREYTQIRSCGRQNLAEANCASAFFTTHGLEYRKVCGRAVGYQYASTDAFWRGELTVDDNYVDGLSVTHGSNPRTHIWTFGAGISEGNPTTNDPKICPCTYPSNPNLRQPSSFVGNNYFCETGNPFHNRWDYILYTADPLWDGQGCMNSACCTFSSPPWFSMTLPAATTDDIEVRICADQPLNTNLGFADEDTPVELLEIYIQ